MLMRCTIWGVLASQVGQHDIAVDLIRRVIALRPTYAEAYGNLGKVLRDKGQPDEAIAALRQAIALKPNFPEAYNNLGNALKDKGQIEEAMAVYHRSPLRLGPVCRTLQQSGPRIGG